MRQHEIQALRRVFGVSLLVTVAFVGCRDSSDAPTDAGVDRDPLSEIHGAVKPIVVFPVEHQQPDASVNQFIRDALQTCAEGDYDGFRQLFSLRLPPPGPTQFQLIWRNVKEVVIKSVHQHPKLPNEYYAHVVVKLRQRDRRDRLERDVVVAVQKEENQWRLAEAPAEIIRQILVADSQPSTRPAEGVGSPGRPATRPANDG